MAKKKTIQKSNTTHRTYKIIKVNITNHEGGIINLTKNVKRWGLEYNHIAVPESIRDFTKYVIWYYRSKNPNPNRNQSYIVYGEYLYVKDNKNGKLVTAYQIPSNFQDEARKLKQRLKGKKKNTKEDIYKRPLKK